MGRVGALAVALGIGAAVAGGAGIARADGAGDGDSGSAGPASTSSASTATTTATETATGSASAPGGAPATAHETDVPKMQVNVGGGASTTADEKTDASGEKPPTSLPELVASIPQKFVESLTHAAPVKKPTRDTTPASVPTPKKDAADDSPAPSIRPLAVVSQAAHVDDAPPVRALVPTVDLAPTLDTPPLAATTVAPTKPPTGQPVVVNPVVTVVSSVLSALGFPPSAGQTGGAPTAPMPIVLGVLQLVRREIENITAQLTWPLSTPTSELTNAGSATSSATTTPSPTDSVDTAYGDIGKWMLQSNGQIANYGGVPHDGRTVLESVNVIIVDPTSQTPAQASAKLNDAMFWSGFPAQPIHSGGFEGTIDSVTYGQQPTLPLFGFSDNLFVFPNDHGRIFGPDPVETGSGYVWSGAFSTEQLTLFHLLPTHEYVSSNMARTALAMRLILSGRATYGGMVPLDNAYNTDTTTTGDHDGYAVVLILR